MPKRTKPFLAIYKVVRNFKHKKHGWIMWGRFVTCTPEYAKNHVIRRELVRCSAERQASAIAKALWIDSIPKIELVPQVELKPKGKPKDESKEKKSDSKSEDSPKAKTPKKTN